MFAVRTHAIILDAAQMSEQASESHARTHARTNVGTLVRRDARPHVIVYRFDGRTNKCHQNPTNVGTRVRLSAGEVSEHIPKRTSVHIPEHFPAFMPDDVLEHIPDLMPEQMCLFVFTLCQCTCQAAFFQRVC